MAEEQEDTPSNPEVHFEPVVKLPLVEIKTLEEEEEVLFVMRAKLFRFDSNEQPPEWKERGVGDVKILKHKTDKTVRILMRRDKTLKVCANHYIQPHMELKPNSTSDRSWMWNTLADFADEEPKPELLALRFANVENAQKFKAAFDQAKKAVIRFLGEGSEKNDSLSEKKEGQESPAKESDSENNNEVEKSPVKNCPEEKDEDTVAEKLVELSVGDKPSETSTEGKGPVIAEDK